MKDLNTALVTGNGRGIGKETALLLAEKGTAGREKGTTEIEKSLTR